jgi:hypothetical protein
MLMNTKIRTLLTIALCAAFLLAGCIPAADIRGDWEYTMRISQGAPYLAGILTFEGKASQGTFVRHITSTGGELRVETYRPGQSAPEVTYSPILVSAPDRTGEYVITDTQISMTVGIESIDGNWTGTISDATHMSGTWEEYGISGTWTAVKLP